MDFGINFWSVFGGTLFISLAMIFAIGAVDCGCSDGSERNRLWKLYLITAGVVTSIIVISFSIAYFKSFSCFKCHAYMPSNYWCCTHCGTMRTDNPKYPWTCSVCSEHNKYSYKYCKNCGESRETSKH